MTAYKPTKRSTVEKLRTLARHANHSQSSAARDEPSARARALLAGVQRRRPTRLGVGRRAPLNLPLSVCQDNFPSLLVEADSGRRLVGHFRAP